MARSAVIGLVVMLAGAPVKAELHPTLGSGALSPLECSPQASVWNPALLGSVSGTVLEGSVAVIGGYFQYERAGNYNPVSVSEVSPLPSLALSTDFGLTNLRAGIAVNIPSGGAIQFPEDGPQRYSLIEGMMIPYTITLPIAFRVMRGLTLGVAPRIVVTQFRSELAVDLPRINPSLFGESAAENPEASMRVELAPVTSASVGWTLGAFYEPDPRLKFSFSIHSPIDRGFSTEVRTSLSRELDFQTRAAGLATTGVAHVKSSIPLMVIGGVRFQPIEPLSVDFFLRWSQWSDTKGVELTISESPVKALNEASVEGVDHHDAFHVGTVVQGNIMRSITVGAHLAFLQSSVPTEALKVSNFDFPSLVPGAFVQWTQAKGRGFSARLGYSRLIALERSVPRQELPPTTGSRISLNSDTSGKYRYGYDQVGINVSYAF